MKFWSGVALAAFCVTATTSAVFAKPTQRASTVAPHQNPVASTRGSLQIQTGQKQASGTQGFKPLQLQVAPRKPENAASPAPLATPEFNPLKRRHMAMPGIPEPDLAF